MKINKKIDGIYQEIEINSGMEEFNLLKDADKLIIYNNELNGDFKSLQEAIIYIEKKQKIKKIKEKYNQIILEKYPYHTQINMSADIQEIHLIARLEKRSFTDTEMLKVQEATDMKNWIQEKRKECNREIENLKNNT